MKTTLRLHACLAIVLLSACVMNGCATLTVTPRQPLNPTAVRQTASLGVLVSGERLRDALSDPDESVVKAASGKLFDRVVILPAEARQKNTGELLTSYGVDYVAAVNISDVNVDGNLNPYWFASLPLFFFKPLAPIVTFEASASLEGTFRDTRTGAVMLQKEASATVTDHFSPRDPQAKVRKLIARGINNAMVGLLGDFQQKVAGK